MFVYFCGLKLVRDKLRKSYNLLAVQDAIENPQCPSDLDLNLSTPPQVPSLSSNTKSVEWREKKLLPAYSFCLVFPQLTVKGSL